MVSAETILKVRTKYESLAPLVDERVRRCWAAAEAKAIGWGGISAVAQATGLSRNTIQVGIEELEQRPLSPEIGGEPLRVRRPGGGRKPLTETDRGLLRDLKKMLGDSTRGDPQSPLKWTSKSCQHLADELNRKGHQVSHDTVANLLHDLDYSLQSNRKTKEGSHHPDRDDQYKHINRQVKAFQKRGQPVISVDTKKRELLGDFHQKGRTWRPKGQPIKVRVHDFEDKQLGHAIPYGVYDLTYNQGWVSVGIDHDTAEFAVETIRHWWYEMGREFYPSANELLVTADAGGSNGYRLRLWKVGLQALADETGLRITVCHFPPGTSKWNKIEHRMFCHITKNWSGTPIVSRTVIVNLIGNTTTDTGLRIKAKLDLNTYPTGIEVTDEEVEAINIEKNKFHGEWNYTISPML
ncbi:MAG: ISAzo13 family transposase [Blastocatellia bacterium]